MSYIETTELKLVNSVARNEKDKDLNLIIELKINAVSDNKNQAIANETILCSGIKYEVDYSQDSDYHKDIRKRCTLSDIFPIPTDGVPISITVKVTEIGSGGEFYGKLSEFIDNNKKSVNEAILKLINDNK